MEVKNNFRIPLGETTYSDTCRSKNCGFWVTVHTHKQSNNYEQVLYSNNKKWSLKSVWSLCTFCILKYCECVSIADWNIFVPERNHPSKSCNISLLIPKISTVLKCLYIKLYTVMKLGHIFYG